MNKKNNWQKTVKHIGGLIILLLLLTLLPSQSIYAATITVNSTADTDVDLNNDTIIDAPADGLCTLREAINNANRDSDTTGGDCVAGAGNDTIILPAGTYTLAQTGLNENANLTGDLDITDPDGLTITGADARTTIIEAGTTSSNGIDRVLHVTAPGVPLTIQNVTIRHGRLNGIAGGIWNQGVLTINDSTVTQNRTYEGSRDGGGIRNQDRLIINNSTLSYNTATRSGGAIHQQGGSIVINNSTITNNIASELIQAMGAGIFVNAGTVTINNSTMASNNASSNSGIGGGIYNNGANTITLKNTIIADNTAGSDPDCSGTLTSNGYNLIENNCGITLATGDIIGSDPQLKPLGNYGGSTDTHELQETSLAKDGGETGSCTAIGGSAIATDQRGETRPENAACDIGAYELGPLAVNLQSFTAMSGGSHVRIEWATVWESNNLGFNLYRNTSAEFSEAERLNEQLIPAEAPGGGGSVYEYEDHNVIPGTTYYYWLADVDVGLHETLHQKITSIDYDWIPTSVRMSNFESSKPSNFSWLVMLTVLGMTTYAISMQRRK